MKLIHKDRHEGKTNDIFWLAHENQPSVILVPFKKQKDYIEKEYLEKLFSNSYDYKPDIKVELFDEYIRNIKGQHHRKIFIDDLDDCLTVLFSQSVEFSSFTTHPICERAKFENILKEKDGKMVCRGYIYGMNDSVCRNCEYCPHQYGHPFDEFWNQKED